MKKIKLLSCILSISFLFTSCFSNQSSNNDEDKSGVVNIYTSRHYASDDQIYDDFTKETGIKVSIIKGNADELIERIKREGEDTEADILFTADVARLDRAKNAGILSKIDSEIINKNINQRLRDDENFWTALTARARVLVYNKDKVNPEELISYEDLTNDEWKGRILTRSSENPYTQSLIASFIAINGYDNAKSLAQGIVNNLARNPEGGDRDQAKAIAAGIGDVAIMNTYYLGQMLNSLNEDEVKIAESLGVIFPNQDTTGTHINISGAGIINHSKNKENATKLIEYLSTTEVQNKFARASNEYPANELAEESEFLKSLGSFKVQDISLSELGKYNGEAVKLLNDVNWK